MSLESDQVSITVEEVPAGNYTFSGNCNNDQKMCNNDSFATEDCNYEMCALKVGSNIISRAGDCNKNVVKCSKCHNNVSGMFQLDLL